MNKKLVGILLALVSASALAKAPPEQIAQLGESLTPLGAEKAGNAAGTIPAWTGGIKDIPGSYDQGKPLPNPFADDTPLFEITGQNYQQYADNLSQGQIALFTQFPQTYRMKVFPTRRSAVFPDWLYAETTKNASRVELSNEGNGFSGTVKGFPFPLPQNGREAMWNHMARYITKGVRGYSNRAITTSSGDYVIERVHFEASFHYNHPDATLENFDNKYVYLMGKIVAPASKAGDATLLHVPLDRVKDETLVYSYNPGQRKVRRIGEVGYDNPLYDGLMTHDQVDMFNGPMDRYQFKLLGKREIYVPYNCYDIYSSDVEYKDILQKGHINPDLARYELHRTWVVEATILDGMKHIYSKRVFYLDEDSWLILLEDMYDTRGEFWRTAISHAIAYYQIPLVANPVQVHYDLQSRRYVMLNMTNEEKKRIEYDWYEPPAYFSTSKLKRYATSKSD